MKIGRFSLSAVSVALLVVQLLLVSSIALKYFYQRWTCPRVWTRAAAIDPELVMRGRYLWLQPVVDGCGSTLPSAKFALFPRDVNGAIRPGPYMLNAQSVEFRANLKVQNNTLFAVRVEGNSDPDAGQAVSTMPSTPCNQMHLTNGVSYFISDRAQSPLPLKSGQELWIELTVPPHGPPRPLQLALKDNGVWKPFNLN